MKSIRLPILAAAAAIALLDGCHHRHGPKPLSELTPTEMQGHEIFQNHCTVCHYPDSEKTLRGPGLVGLFQKPYLPSGVPVTDARVRAMIIHGRGVMPPFGNVLDAQQMQDLLAYLHTL